MVKQRFSVSLDEESSAWLQAQKNKSTSIKVLIGLAKQIFGDNNEDILDQLLKISLASNPESLQQTMNDFINRNNNRSIQNNLTNVATVQTPVKENNPTSEVSNNPNATVESSHTTTLDYKVSNNIEHSNAQVDPETPPTNVLDFLSTKSN